MESDATEQAIQNCLRQMDALATELGTAMTAIAANSLSRLHESLTLQRKGSLEVSAAFAQIRSANAPEKPGPPHFDERLQAAALRLWTVNQQYAALLEHAGRSVSMLRSLYDGNDGIPLRSLAARGLEQRQTWSWEG